MTRCKICGRELTNPEHAAKGIGPICATRQRAAEINEHAQQVLLFEKTLEDEGLICRRLESGELACNIAQRHVWHSPTGFECGYLGSGPADLALNVLAQLIPAGADGLPAEKIFGGTEVSATAVLLHQAFKERFIATMDREGGTIPIEEIRAWIAHESNTPAFKKQLTYYDAPAL